MTTTSKSKVERFKVDVDCWKCDGKGVHLHWRHINDGTCYACHGTGKISFETFYGDHEDWFLEVFKKDGRFWYAVLSNRTWIEYPWNGQTTREWGKDRSNREIHDVEEARKLWTDSSIKHGLNNTDLPTEY
tara:strand:+ start:282 stop:674 length:393 start_codon:yes stop_codon:yes gene_type:complete